MKEILLIIKYLGILLLIRIPMILSGLVVLAVVLPFISKKRETLPRAFRWYDNAAAHRAGRPHYSARDMTGDSMPSMYPYTKTHIDGLSAPPRWRWPKQWQLDAGYTEDQIQDGYSGYPFLRYNYFKHLYQRYRWLAIRNPVNYFSYKVLGKEVARDFMITSIKQHVTKTGEEITNGEQTLSVENTGIEIYRVHAINAGQSLYELSISGNYSLLGIKRNIDCRIGYKMIPIGDEVVGDTLQFTFRINPFRSPR